MQGKSASDKSTQQTFWSQAASYWFKQLQTEASGLTETEATHRLARLPGRRKPMARWKKDVRLFIRQYESPLMLLLIGAVLLSAWLGDTSDVFIILFIVLSTGILSFLQERNAGRVVEKLQSLIAMKSTVLRDGNAIEIPSEKLVPGDVLRFKAGDLIPADCLLIEANELHANEASLTGESFPVRKETAVLPEATELAHRSNCLWEGTSIVSGTGSGLVIQTGERTLFGHIAQSASVVVETSFEKGIKDFGYFLMKITLVLCVCILIINLLNHKNVMESALFALALAVGMAPELLPAITTIAMSSGAKRMLEKKVIVKKLSAIQNLGEVNLLCTDKTGTITEGAIQVKGMMDADGKESEQVKRLACWNSQLESGYTNPLDEAIKSMPGQPAPVKKLAEIPYDFIRKRLSVAVDTGAEKCLITKGAYSQVIQICSRADMKGDIRSLAEVRAQVDALYASWGNEGMRVIAVAYKPMQTDTANKTDECEMIFAGFILLEDPVKSGINEALAQLRGLQVGLKVITGDNRNVAMSVAKQIGVQDPVVMTGQELLQTSPEALPQKVKQTHIFAEVEPQQKERLIQALRNSYTVAYMGDGINDVSAINAADVGISVENAVDVAREAADFVLMEKNLDVLADGIREGRKTFSNTLKYIFINTGSTFGNMFSVAIASVLLPFLPMLPKQILLTNFITDFPYLSIASDNVDEEQTTRPGRWNLRFIRNYMIIFGLHSSLFDVITFLTLNYLLRVKESVFQTGWFVESILTELFILFIIRTTKNFFRSRPGNYLMILSIAGLLLTLGLPYSPLAKEIGLSPLDAPTIGSMLGIVLAYVWTADWLKIWFFRRYSEMG